VVFGDRRPYNVALIVLDPDGLAALRRSQDLPSAELAELARHPRVLAAVDEAVARGNATLSRVEHVKRHVVLDHVWLPADFALTATAKLKRAQIEERYQAVIDELYAPAR
jgi:long-subunit acyl-CoA synthetase (AMP-forming)